MCLPESDRRSEDEWLAGSPDQREEQRMRLMEEQQRRLMEEEMEEEKEILELLKKLLYNLVLGFMFLFIGLSLLKNAEAL